MSKKSPAQRVKFFAIIAFVMVIVGYTLFEMRGAILGVNIVLDEATESVASVRDPLFPLHGLASHAEILTVNGRVVPIDQSGRFEDAIVLSEGYNRIELAAKDKFGKEDTVELSVVFIR